MNGIAELLGGQPVKALLIASTGGHLAQLFRFSANWNLSDESLWVTFESPQSLSLLAGKRVQYVPYVPPRGLKEAFDARRAIKNILRTEKFDAAISTGAAIAVSGLPDAAKSGVPSFYIESVSRVHGPSLSGRILARVPGIRTYTQHSHWSSRRWVEHPSVLDQFLRVERDTLVDRPRLFVTLGTIKPYRFDSIIDGVLRSGLADSSTVWQVGVTGRKDLPGVVHDQMSAGEFMAAAQSSDVVVTHAGVGSVITLLEAGIHPVVVPRLKRRGEHVDDHQLQIAGLLERSGVATVRDAEALERENFRSASRYSTRGLS